MPVILTTEETEIGRIAVRSQPAQIFQELNFKNIQCKEVLVEWLK
jgi:hypothetical protein